MRSIRTIGTVSVLPVWVLLALGCHDGAGSRTPTDPALDARSAQASFSRDGDDDDDEGGSKFRLIGNARMARDPENGRNIVLEVVSDPTFAAAGAYRRLHDVQLWELDHQLSFHRAFVAPHTCGGGSPRIQLTIDADGDGKFQQAPAGPDFVAHGHVRPPHAGCETSTPLGQRKGPSESTLLWRFEDLTDELPRWEITPGGVIEGFPVFPFAPWDVLERLVSAAFPDHKVLRATFLEDFSPTPGLAYYDLITIYDLTLGTKGQTRADRDDRRDRDDRDDRD